MGFFLAINYRAPSREMLFLSSGWGGVRDVRGPYLIESPGVIAIAPWALACVEASELRLVFGLSNRSPVDAVTFRVSGLFGSSTHIIQKNADVDVHISNILAVPESDEYRLSVDLTFGLSKDVDPLICLDLLSLDHLSINRGRP